MYCCHLESTSRQAETVGQILPWDIPGLPCSFPWPCLAAAKGGNLSLTVWTAGTLPIHHQQVLILQPSFWSLKKNKTVSNTEHLGLQSKAKFSQFSYIKRVGEFCDRGTGLCSNTPLCPLLIIWLITVNDVLISTWLLETVDDVAPKTWLVLCNYLGRKAPAPNCWQAK